MLTAELRINGRIIGVVLMENVAGDIVKSDYVAMVPQLDGRDPVRVEVKDFVRQRGPYALLKEALAAAERIGEDMPPNKE